MKTTLRLSPVLIALALCGGCSVFRPGVPSTADVRPEAGPQPRVRELPPERAAEVCLATARELESNDHEQEAIQQYERARQLRPRLPGVARRLAVLYDRQGDHDRAQAEYRKALQESPRDAGLLNDFGYFQYQRGDWTEAEKALRKALEIDPRHERAWVNLALTLGEQQRYDESVEAFGRAVSPAAARHNSPATAFRAGRHAAGRR